MPKVKITSTPHVNFISSLIAKKINKWALKGEGIQDASVVDSLSKTRSNILPCVWVEWLEC